ncbi:MAG: hypothetical protein AAFX06_15255 [Planctomycetota bacterium]
MNDEHGDSVGRQEFLRILVDLGEEPAFVSRARAPQAALDGLVAAYEKRREELLRWPRRHFTALRSRVRGDWQRLRKHCREEDANRLLESLSSELSELAPYDNGPFMSDRALLKAFVESGRRFNSEWQAILEEDELTEVNRVRREYNEYYPIEKAAAFGTDRFNANFEPLDPLEGSFLIERFPLLRLPTLTK